MLLTIIAFPISVLAKVELPAKICVDSYETVQAYEACMRDALPRDDEATNSLYHSLLQVLKDKQRQATLHSTQDKWFASLFRHCSSAPVPHPDKSTYNAAETSCLALGYETRMLELDKISARCQSNISGDIIKCNYDITIFSTDPGSM